ncbi:uncharacterized protein LOC105834531 [Monomorium pharaonis]|uniref:uncharacterized protein LOC105834531 n=1 Tax=Monomorium pharaonis TaxID=307658 RepID=UPI001746989A|nr:uncharacterized protein LOC105834531 [Monomorium pharaonis]XP_036140455.1 uncharacterized protein LOC105834531 [Monomorium pharaonis]
MAMLHLRAPCIFLLIFTVSCLFRYNAAVPLASHSSHQIQNAFKNKETDSQSDWDSTLNSRSTREVEASDATSDDDDEDDDENDEDDDNDEIQNTIRNVNQNWNINRNIFDRRKHPRIKQNYDKRHKQNTTEGRMTVKEQETLEEIVQEEVTNCASKNKKNQRYSSSFLVNTTGHLLTVDKEFHDVVGNNSKVKKSSSVHDGEDITLCWIETTTIKEDKTMQPPKRLVIREYTISFENSATIPERYLECKRFEGELMANDPDVGKTALFEVIDEDTMVSRIVNFTSVSHVGDIIIWQHKKVKCGVGPVVSKNIIELTDDSKNPKKRVEIKVSPKINQLMAVTTEQEPCTESTTTYTTGLPCESTGTCETMTSPSISTKDEKEIVSKTESESKEDYSLITDTKLLPAEEESGKSTISSKILTTTEEPREKIVCDENSSDPACLIQIHGTSSSEELFPELITSTEASTTEAVTSAEISSISDTEITTKEEISHPSIEERSKETTSFLSEEKTEISNLVTQKTTAFATDVSTESSEEYVPQSTNEASVEKISTEESNIISLETKSSSAIEDAEEYSKFEEGSESSIELTSEELSKISEIVSSSSEYVTSEEVDIKPVVTSALPPTVGYTEFTQLDKLSERPISTESVTGTIIAESSPTSEQVSSEESKESTTSTVEGTSTRVRSKTEKDEFISTIMTKTISPTMIKSTIFLPVTSSKTDYSCENSEECAGLGSCDESGHCGETTTKCDSEICSEEEVTESQSKFDDISPPIKTPPLVVDLQLPEKSTMIEDQHTTVTMGINSQESETWTAINIPITSDARRSTTTSTPQHKLTLKVKVLVEHINENKEKQNLVEVEKQLSLDENVERHDIPNLLEQLKSLNDSVNMETISALLNCTSLGNLTRDANFINKKLDNAIKSTDGDADMEFANSKPEDSMSEQFISDSSEYQDRLPEYQEVPPRRRRRRSLDDEIENLNRLVKRDLNSTDSMIDSSNISKSLHTELTTDNLQFSATTIYSDEETINTESKRNVTRTGENEQNVTRDESMMFSTLMSVIDDDLSNTSESHNINLTKDNIQLTTINKPELTTNKLEAMTNKPEEEINNAGYIENENNTTNERNESTMPLINETISSETRMKVMQETLPDIQKDVMDGLQHMISKLTQNVSLASAIKVREAIRKSLLDILADPKDKKVRRKRAATEEVGHWSNERIKKTPMGGNLRSVTEFTLYKVLH